MIESSIWAILNSNQDNLIIIIRSKDINKLVRNHKPNWLHHIQCESEYGKYRIGMLKGIEVVIVHLAVAQGNNFPALWIHEIWSLEKGNLCLIMESFYLVLISHYLIFHTNQRFISLGLIRAYFGVYLSITPDLPEET